MVESSRSIGVMPEAGSEVWAIIDSKIPIGAKAQQYGKWTLHRNERDTKDEFFTLLGGFSEEGGDNRRGYVFFEGASLRVNLAILKSGDRHMTLLSEEGSQKLLAELRSAVA